MTTLQDREIASNWLTRQRGLDFLSSRHVESLALLISQVRDEADAAGVERERALVEVLTTISQQRTTPEMQQDPDWDGEADYEFAYDMIVSLARGIILSRTPSPEGEAR